MLSPLSGLIVPVTQVPDPVFANGLAGNGIAIDPTEGKVLAPCDGKILNLHPSRHALTLALEDGSQLLIHIGIDTVKLRGQGFTARVKNGEQVKRGQLLIEFDLDAVALAATSLISPVILVEPKDADLKFTNVVQVSAGKDELFSFASPAAKATAESTDFNDAVGSRPIRVTDPTGLHARPAAVIANLASQYGSNIQIELNGRKANAKSLIGIMGLEIAGNATVRFWASGSDAKIAIEALEENLGSSQQPSSETALASKTSFKGVVGSKGRAAGRVHFLKRQVTTEDHSSSPSEEKTKLKEALKQAKDELHLVEKSMREELGSDGAAIFAAHRGLLDDPDLLSKAFDEIQRGRSAAQAWQLSVSHFSAKLLGLKTELLASRASDLQDVGQRVLTKLCGTRSVDFGDLTEDAILVAEDVGPGDLANLRGTRVAGICTTTGGATSHAAIIARALGLPALLGLSKDVLQIAENELAVLDAIKGELKLAPTSIEIEEVQTSNTQTNLQRQQELRDCLKPASTSDGHVVLVAANLSTVHESIQASELGAAGVGLLRSELYFSEKLVEPTEEEQFEFYRTIASKFKEHPTVIRTLDVGGDKPLPYLPMKPEANPFLGERGIRFTLTHERLFRRQIRAIVRAAEFGNVHIMFPMISSLSELIEAKRILEDETRDLKAERIPVGIMIEVPSAALIADQLAREVDFLSIGTNDLTQYTLAMDRTNSNLSKRVDGIHPGVLRLIQLTVEAARRHKKRVGVCGGLAAEPEAIPALLGLGVDELSVSVPAIPSVRAAIRKLSLSECKSLTAKCLGAADASEVLA